MTFLNGNGEKRDEEESCVMGKGTFLGGYNEPFSFWCDLLASLKSSFSCMLPAHFYALSCQLRLARCFKTLGLLLHFGPPLFLCGFAIF